MFSFLFIAWPKCRTGAVRGYVLRIKSFERVAFSLREFRDIDYTLSSAFYTCAIMSRTGCCLCVSVYGILPIKPEYTGPYRSRSLLFSNCLNEAWCICAANYARWTEAVFSIILSYREGQTRCFLLLIKSETWSSFGATAAPKYQSYRDVMNMAARTISMFAELL